jgi:hypothetical protein
MWNHLTNKQKLPSVRHLKEMAERGRMGLGLLGPGRRSGEVANLERVYGPKSRLRKEHCLGIHFELLNEQNYEKAMKHWAFAENRELRELIQECRKRYNEYAELIARTDKEIHDILLPRAYQEQYDQGYCDALGLLIWMYCVGIFR